MNYGETDESQEIGDALRQAFYYHCIFFLQLSVGSTISYVSSDTAEYFLTLLFLCSLLLFFPPHFFSLTYAHRQYACFLRFAPFVMIFWIKKSLKNVSLQNQSFGRCKPPHYPWEDIRYGHMHQYTFTSSEYCTECM